MAVTGDASNGPSTPARTEQVVGRESFFFFLFFFSFLFPNDAQLARLLEAIPWICAKPVKCYEETRASASLATSCGVSEKSGFDC